VRPKTRVELAALVEQALAASRLDRDHTVRITRQLQAGIAVDALQTELARALANLLGNADRYGRDPDSGRLDLSLRLAHRDGQAVIEVADRGRGVPPERLQDLLRPFVRGEEARTGAAGAGLGLAIVDRVARMHGGRLRLEPNEPSGLRATLSLPLPG
jgi:two-component system osmolarity sensor histidine kinase EnvZ